MNGGRHCHNNNPDPQPVVGRNIENDVEDDAVEMPQIDFVSGQTGYYEVIRVYDGDTITIRTPKGTTPSLRLVGVDTPEINADTQAEKDRAIAARDYLRGLILNKHIFITFEKSDTTLDGIARGAFCRPLSYIFIRDEASEKNIFVNLEIVWQGHGIKYFKYDFEFEDFFRLDRVSAQDRIDDLELSPPDQNAPQQSSNPNRRLSTTWAELKQVK